jgi:uncharacterized delta-60 repeat protein
MRRTSHRSRQSPLVRILVDRRRRSPRRGFQPAVHRLEDRTVLSLFLDPSFGTGGIVTSQFTGPVNNSAHSLLLQQGGKMIVVGESDWAQGPAIAVARYSSDGSLDTTFGTGGTATVLPPIPFYAAGAALDPQGNILIVGQAAAYGPGGFVVARLNGATGGLDTTFKGTGEETVPQASSWGSANRVTVDPLGRIVLGGYSNNGTLAVARLNSDGSLDTTFNGTGLKDTGVGVGGVTGLLIDPSGNIVGTGSPSFSGPFTAVRLTSNGSLDPSFNGSGYTKFFVSYDDTANAAAIGSDGRIIMVGSTVANGSTGMDFAVAQINSNGSLAFRETINIGPGGTYDIASGVTIDLTTGQIIVAGTSMSPDNTTTSFVVARLNGTDGSLDTTFGAGTGIQTFAGNADRTTSVAGVAIDSTGQIDVAGTKVSPGTGTGQDFVVATLDGSNGGRLTHYVTTDIPGLTSDTGASNVAIQKDGKIVVADDSSVDIAVARYNPDGSLDSTFGTGGVASTTANWNWPGTGGFSALSVAVDPNTRQIAVAGFEAISETEAAPVLILLDSNGNEEKMILLSDIGSAPKVAFDSQSRIIAAGSDSTQADLIIMRLNSDGSKDTSFGSNGEAVLTGLFPIYDTAGVAIDPASGGVVVAGTTFSGPSAPSSVFVARLTDAGVPDKSFGSGDESSFQFNPRLSIDDMSPTNHAVGLAVDNSGRIVVGCTMFINTGPYLAVARVDSNGVLDPAFNGTGLETLISGKASGVAIDRVGRLIIAGTGGSGFEAERLDPDGGLDTYFGSGGVVSAGIGDPGTMSDFASGVAVDGVDIVVAGSEFNNSSYYHPSNLALVRVLGGAPTVTAVVSSAVSSIAEQEVTLTTTVTAAGAVAGAPSGAVDFIDSTTGTDLGPATLDGNGSATFRTAFAVAETHVIVAHYDGDSVFASSWSTPLSVTVSALTSQGLQDVVNALPTGGSVNLAPPDIATLDTALSAVAGLSIGSGSPAGIVLDLSPTDYAHTDSGGNVQPIDVTAPANTTLTLSGPASGSATLHDLVTSGTVTIQGNITVLGSSPALVVFAGATKVVGGVTLITATDAPTILVSGGTLTLRNSTVVQQSTVYNQVAIQVTGGTVDLGTYSSPGGNTIQVDGAGALIQDTGPDPTLPSLSGIVYQDFNQDGQVDFGESGIPGVTIDLDGTDSLGNSVHLCQKTDGDGAYVFLVLQPGWYTITETQPSGYLQGINSVGTAGGTVSGDQFTVNLPPDLAAMNYNYGERPAATGAIKRGQTAGIGFWNNKNGQALIKALNGGGASTRLGDWLAATLPHIFGALAGSNNLAGKSNAFIAALFQSDFVVHGTKLDAQVLATALAVYVTDSTLDNTGVGTQYGFLVGGNGVATSTVNVGSNGAAFGVANNTAMTVLDILLAADAQAVNGVLYNGNATRRNQANTVFSAINEAGGL